MNKTILSEKQQTFLSLFSKQKDLVKLFYLSGGTALAGFYIPYRYSDDLDFFSGQEVDCQAIMVFLRSVKKQLGYKAIDISTSFNRNLFFLQFGKESLKTEFTYYPFPQINQPTYYLGISIDSILDIAVNKLFTIYQKPRARDFMDLYKIIDHYDFSMNDLIIKAKAKFDWHVDPIQLGSQFMQAVILKDYPKLIKPLSERAWQEFFLKEAKKLGKEIIGK